MENVADKYFTQALKDICIMLEQRYRTTMLTNENIINALSSKVSMKKEKHSMPKVPLYFDVICTDVAFFMRENDIIQLQ